MYKTITAILKLLFKIFYRVEVDGNINISEKTRYMICANHIHMFDPAFLMITTKRPIVFMIKKELAEKPILGKILLKCGAIPVDRGKGDIESIKASIESLNNENVLSVFPEGTRHKDGKFRDIKKGAAMIAIRANAPIVPVRIIGNYRLFSKMIMKIGKPIDVYGYKKDELTELIKNEIEALA